MLIESVYATLRRRGGQRAQLEAPVDPSVVAASFAATVEDLSSAGARGPFYPSGSRTPLSELGATRAQLKAIADTEHLQALMWTPPRWRVEGHQELDFHFLAREITPTSSVGDDRARRWLVADSERRVSIDALLMNADDRTPIVAEIKVGGDENAELALVQALAAAAQISTPAQRKRLQTEYRDHLGADAVTRLDIYVIVASAPTAGTRPMLAARARELAAALANGGELDAWIRRIVFLEAQLDYELTFRISGSGATA